MKMRKIKNKKGQEEMVGFVIIILLVITIGIVFLGFSLRQKQPEVQHQESMMLDVMQAMLAYSSCGDNSRELIKDCYRQPSRQCNGEYVCDYVEELFIDILDEALGGDIADSHIHGYIMNISNSQMLIYSEKNEITGNYFGASIPIQVSGQDIFFNLRFYYST